MTFSGNHTKLSEPDTRSDAHAQYSLGLRGGMYMDNAAFVAQLEMRGWTGPWDDYDSIYAHSYRDPFTNHISIMGWIEAYLNAASIATAPPPTDPATYPGKPDYDTALMRLARFGLVLPTSGTGERKPFVNAYWANKLTPENPAVAPAIYDELWMAEKRGLWLLPETISIAPPGFVEHFTTMERAIGWWGLRGTDELREDARDAEFFFESYCVPAPSGETSGGSPPGSVSVVPGEMFYKCRKVLDKIILGPAWEAAVNCTRFNGVCGVVSIYTQHAMQTYPLSPNDWRYALGLPLDYSDSGSGGIGIGEPK